MTYTGGDCFIVFLGFQAVSSQFPGSFWLFPDIFQVVSGKFMFRFRVVSGFSRQFPFNNGSVSGQFQLVSGQFPVSFRSVSSQFPVSFRVVFKQFLGSFRVVYRQFPSSSILGSFFSDQLFVSLLFYFVQV